MSHRRLGSRLKLTRPAIPEAEAFCWKLARFNLMTIVQTIMEAVRNFDVSANHTKTGVSLSNAPMQ